MRRRSHRWAVSPTSIIRAGGRSPAHEDVMIRLRRPFVPFPSLPILAATVGALALVPLRLEGQDADPRPARPDTSLRFPNTIAGEFTPAVGFDIVKTKFGSLNISVYGLFRYLNQVPG